MFLYPDEYHVLLSAMMPGRRPSFGMQAFYRDLLIDPELWPLAQLRQQLGMRMLAEVARWCPVTKAQLRLCTPDRRLAGVGWALRVVEPRLLEQCRRMRAIEDRRAWAAAHAQQLRLGRLAERPQGLRRAAAGEAA